MEDGPSLAEITNIKGDANIAGGSSGGAEVSAPNPVQFDEGLKFLNEAAMAKAGYNKYLQEQYQKNLTDNLTNLRSIDFSKALPEDLPALRQQYAELANGYANNFDAVRNPASNPEMWDQLNQQEATLRGNIGMSTAHNAVYSQNKKFLNDNPNWQTPYNQTLMANYGTTPMDQRANILLKTPTDVNLDAVAKTANNIVEQKIAKETTNGKYLNKSAVTNYDPQAFNDAFMSTLRGTFSHGVSLYDQAKENISAMPKSMKVDADGKQLDDDQYLQKVIIPGLRSKNSTSTAISADPYGELAQTEGFEAAQQQKRQDFEAAQGALDRAQRSEFQKKGTIDPVAAGDSALKTLAISESTGNIPSTTGQTLFANNDLISKTVKIPNKGKPGDDKLATSSTVKMPAETYLYSKRDSNGNFRIFLRNNATGELIEKATSHNELISNLASQYGPTFAPQIASAISKFSISQFKKPIPEESDLIKYYGLPEATLPQPQGLSNVGGKLPATNGVPANTVTPSVPVSHKLKYNPASGQFE